ncbi:MAG: mechanosensitive ion channel family protein [Flavobacteriales bacterium]
MGIRNFLETGFSIGNYTITWLDALLVMVIFATAQAVVWLFRWLLGRLLSKTLDDPGKRFMVIRLMRTVVYVIAGIGALETVGIDLTGLLLGSAALLVGIGIGLQNFFNDVVSGFVILFEGGVRVGDELEVDGMLVRVERIDLRSTRVVTRRGDLIVMPNGLISGSRVKNFTQGEPRSMINIRVGVAYGSDTDQVESILRQAALDQPEVNEHDPIVVVFDDFGDSALVFDLRCFVTHPWQRDRIASDIRFRIDRRFRKSGVIIPFPQRDLHVYSATNPLRVALSSSTDQAESSSDRAL